MASLEVLPGPQTVQEGRAYKGRHVIKQFEVDGVLHPFHGIVKAVWLHTAEAGPDGQPGAQIVMFDVKYSDGDAESLTWAELLPVLQSIETHNATPHGRQGKRSAASNALDAGAMSAGGNRSCASVDTFAKRSRVWDAAPDATPRPALAERSLNAAPNTMHGMETDGASDRKASAMRSGVKRGAPVTQLPDSTEPGCESQHTQPDQTVRRQRARTAAAPDFGAAMAATVAEAEEMAPQKPGAHRKRGLAGHLKRIALRDFMCHAHFEMEFGPHVTLVSGTNGSGKSAVLQGLQCCLGVSARDTGRSKRLDGFIRTGAETATVTVALWNEGSEAYRPELYGREIVLERRIRRNGSGEYRLHGEGGRVVPGGNRRDELAAILGHFNIAASNPLTIMTQDLARSFLAANAAGKRDKYDMYMQGTMLREISASLQSSDLTLHKARENLRAAETWLGGLVEGVTKMEADLAKLRDLQRLHDVKGHIVRFAPWQLLAELREQLAALQASVDEQRDALSKSGCKVMKCEATLASVQQRMKDRREELERVLAEAQSLANVLASLKERVNRRVTDRKRAAKEVAEHGHALEELRQQAAEYEQQLAQAEADRPSSEQVARARQELEVFEQQLRAREETMRAMEDEFLRNRTDTTALLDRLEAHKSDMQQHNWQTQHLQKEVADLQQQLQAVRQPRSNGAALFGGPRAVQLVAALQRAQQRLRHPVVGPIGMHLGLTDSKWSKAVDSQLYGVLNRFICFCMEDSRTLLELGRQVGYNNVPHTVLKWGIPKHTVPRRYPQGYMSILDVLTVTHPDPGLAAAIHNLAVDVARVETILLVTSSEQGRDVVYNNAAGPGVSAVDMDGTAYRQANGTAAVRRNNYSGALRLGLDPRERVAQLQDLVGRAQAELLAADERGAVLRAEHDRLQAQHRELRTQGAQMVQAKIKLRSELNGLLAKRQELLPGLGTDGLDDGSVMIQHATQAINTTRVDISSTQMRLDEKHRALEEAQAAEAEARAEYEAKRDTPAVDVGQVNSELEQLAGEEAEARARLEGARAVLAERQAQLDNCLADLTGLSKQEAQVVALAQKEGTEEEAGHSERALREHFTLRYREQRGGRRTGTQAAPGASAPDDGATQDAMAAFIDRCMQHEALCKEAKRLDALLTEVQREAGGDADAVEAELERAKRDVDKHTAKLALQRACILALVDGHNARVTAFTQLRANMRNKLNHDFSKYMGRRGHLGLVDIDDDAGELSVRVKVKGKTDANSKWVEDLKQLSGGERSYTMVALLLAVGNWNETPFRCMDEYDVFMDAVNRRIATEALLHFAAEKHDLQFVLLTPQDLAAIDDARKELESKMAHELGSSFLKMVSIRPARDGAQPV